MAIDPVLIRFAVGGLTDVSRAFDTVEQRILKFEQRTTQASETAAKTRVKATKDEADYVEKVRRRSSEMAGQMAEREAAKELREKQRLARDLENVHRRSSEMAGRLAEQQANREIREAERAAAQIERTHERVRRAIGSASSRGVSSALGGVGSMAAGALAIGGGFALADVARRQLGSEQAAALLVNSATIGGKAAPGANVGNILGTASAVAKETGVDKTALIAAVQNYVAKSADFEGGMANMGFFARLSKATGTRIEDITGAAGIIRAQNKDIGVKDMQQMLLDLTEQGKQGAVEISDLARLAGGLGASRGYYAGNMAENQRKLMALAQFTVTESTSPEEAATAVKDLAGEGLHDPKRVARLKAMGVHITKSGQIEDVQQMIEAAMLGTSGNLTALTQQFGMRGVRVFQRLAPIFQKAGGGQVGIEAIRQEMAPIMGAKGSQSQLSQQFEEVMSTPAERLGRAFTQLEETAGQRLEPVLERVADILVQHEGDVEKVMNALLDLGNWLATNPWSGLGLLIGATIEKEILAAGLRSVLAGTLKQEIGGLFAGGLAVGSATLLAGALFQGNNRAANAELLAGVGADVARLGSGRVSPADVAAAQEDVRRLGSEKAMPVSVKIVVV